MKRKYFKYHGGKLPLPVFFPDATRAVVKTLDFSDVESTRTPGVLVNTFHLWQGLDRKLLDKFGNIANFMNWDGAVVSDSGGFQVMSLIKKGQVKGKITDEGVVLYPGHNRRVVFTPEESISFQMRLGSDMVIVLDDFTHPKVSYKEAKISVERTIEWAKRSKKEFEKYSRRPYFLAVVQGGEFAGLRKYCTEELVKIGFDGLGWGGWPFDEKGKISFKTAKIIADNSPKNYLLHGLGIGKPEDIVKCVSLGFSIFDCVLPTRDGRHGRLYVFEGSLFKQIDIRKSKYRFDEKPICTGCDCLTCRKYSRAYLSYLFSIDEISAMRLASIHNLRFYSILMEKLRS